MPRIAAAEWTQADGKWYGGGRLLLAEPRTSHSICPSWSDDGQFLGWYVNLEDPWRSSPLGFDTTDHFLDIWVFPDRSWRWKDEDDLDEAVDVGLFTLEEARAIRAEGERVVERAEAGTAPFDEGWESWRPDPEWPLPLLPRGWDRL
jgi:predicted RNA-binding protein associated with RNAse of E/G family